MRLPTYHKQNVDPRAISIAFKDLAQKHPEAELEIVALEKRGSDSFNVKVQTAPEVDKSALSAEYFSDYYHLRALAQEQKSLLAEKYSRIDRLEQMISTALRPPFFNVIQGDFMPQNNDTETFNNHFEGATVGNFANKLTDDSRQQAKQNIYDSNQRQSLSDAAREIQNLLNQLEETNPNSTETEQVIYVNSRISPTVKERVVSSLQAGGEAAIEKFLNNPYINVGKAIVKAWINPG